MRGDHEASWRKHRPAPWLLCALVPFEPPRAFSGGEGARVPACACCSLHHRDGIGAADAATGFHKIACRLHHADRLKRGFHALVVHEFEFDAATARMSCENFLQAIDFAIVEDAQADTNAEEARRTVRDLVEHARVGDDEARANIFHRNARFEEKWSSCFQERFELLKRFGKYEGIDYAGAVLQSED